MASTGKSGKLIKPKPQMAELSIPNQFRCPISLDLMKDPVTVSTGITYDRHSIETWLDMGNSSCPVTNQELIADEVIPNHSLRRYIQDWCAAHRSHGIERIPTPKIPITTAQASDILAEIPSLSQQGGSESAARARELATRVGHVARESERNRRCFVAAGAAPAFAALFSKFSYTCSSAQGALDEILWTIVCFQPLDYETCRYLGSRDSLKSIAWILKHGDLSARLSAVAVIKEVVSTSKETIQITGDTDGLAEALIELVREQISPRATKASLAVSFFMTSSSEETATRFVDSGMVPLLLDVLVDSDKATCEKALAVFDALCSSERGREEACGHALTVPVLVKKMFRVSDLATEFVVSALWKLCKNRGGVESGGVLVEAIQVGAFQKVLLLLQVGCSGRAKEKATELLKLMNGFKEKYDCIDVMDFKGGLKRA